MQLQTKTSKRQIFTIPIYFDYMQKEIKIARGG